MELPKFTQMAEKGERETKQTATDMAAIPHLAASFFSFMPFFAVSLQPFYVLEMLQRQFSGVADAASYPVPRHIIKRGKAKFFSRPEVHVFGYTRA